MQDIVCTNCGLVNDYTSHQAGPHLTAFCNGCDAYIKHLPQKKVTMIYFGKYAGRKLEDLTSDADIAYLKWLVNGKIKDRFREAIVEHLKNNSTNKTKGTNL